MSMGIGRVGRPDVIFKRKFRWTMQVAGAWGYVPEHFCTIAARPKLTLEETEVNYLNHTTWVPGKAKWEPITVTYLDVPNAGIGDLYSWIATLYNFNSNDLPMSEKAGWNASAIIQLYDGCGSVLERWVLGSIWPSSVDFGDLSYEDSDMVKVELQLRYSEVNYAALCGPQPQGRCTGC